MPKPREPLWERYDRFVDRSAGPDGCWVWKGARVNGYGVFQIEKGKMVKAHRLAFERFNGPTASHILHSNECVGRECVNPSHLRAGTRHDNMQDLKEKGNNRVLNCEQVKDLMSLRDMGVSWGRLAKQFGTSPITVKKSYERGLKGDFGGRVASTAIRKVTWTTPEMVLEMQNLIDAGASISSVSRQFGVSHRAIRFHCGPSKVAVGRPKRALQ